MKHKILRTILVAVIAAGGPIPDVTVKTDDLRDHVTISTEKVERPKGTTRYVPKPTTPARPDLKPWESVCGMSDSREKVLICSDRPDSEPTRQELDAEVLRASQTIGIPQVQARTSPATEVFVNIDTVLHADAKTFTSEVTLLGERIQIRAVPSRFTWQHGDGTKQTTSRAGRPWPNKDVTHRYVRTAHAVSLRVDTTYRISYRVESGPWRSLTSTVTVNGPTTELRVREAQPVLVHR